MTRQARVFALSAFLIFLLAVPLSAGAGKRYVFSYDSSHKARADQVEEYEYSNGTVGNATGSRATMGYDAAGNMLQRVTLVSQGADSDGDGMPDAWEEQYPGLDPQTADGHLDLDNDGLTNLEEYQQGTDPAQVDTDGDGMADGWEVDNSLLPTDPSDGSTDPDGDGYVNYDEYRGNSDPNDSASMPAFTILTIAGTGNSGRSGDGGPAHLAMISIGSGMDIDAEGNIYLADTGNHRIRKIDNNEYITFISGTYGYGGYNGDEIPASSAYLNSPEDVLVADNGNIYIADGYNHRVRMIDTAGIIHTVVGTGTSGFSGDGGPATSAQIQSPHALEMDGEGNLYVATGNRVRKVDAAGIITTYAGNGNSGWSEDGVPATETEIWAPYSLAFDENENLYISAYWGMQVSMVDSNGIIHAVAGVGHSEGYSGDNGPAVQAQLDHPWGIAHDKRGSLYICDNENHRIRRVDAYGVIHTFAGTGTAGFSGDDGPPSEAQLYSPMGMTVAPDGTLYFMDGWNYRIRRIDVDHGPDYDEDGDGMPGVWEKQYTGLDRWIADGNVDFDHDGLTNLQEYHLGLNPTLVDTDVDGMSDGWEIANSLLPLNSADGILDADGDGYSNYAEFDGGTDPHDIASIPVFTITTFAGTGTSGFSGDGAAALLARIYPDGGITTDAAGNIYLADTYNNRVRKIDTSGIITTIAGMAGSGYNGDGISATTAKLYYPSDVKVAANGNIYIADKYNHRVRMVDTSGIIHTIAGTGTSGNTGDGGPAVSAGIYYPMALELDDEGCLYIASGQRIRKVDTAGVITTYAGDGNSGYGANEVLATASSLYSPQGLAFDGQGNLYIAEYNAHRIRMVDTAGIIHAAAGIAGSYGYSGDGGAAVQAKLYNPQGIFHDGQGNLYISDAGNYRLRRLDAYGVIHSFAGTGTGGFSGDGGPPSQAQLQGLRGVTVGLDGALYIVERSNYRIRKID